MGTYYNHITKLPLGRFIDVLVEEDLKPLIIEGQVEDFILRNAWLEIQEQYVEAIGDFKQKIILDLFKDVNKIANSIQLVYFLVSQLQKVYVKQFAKELNKLVNSNFSFDVQNPEQYDKNLKACISRTKGKEMDLVKKKAQLEKLQPKEGEGEKPTREHFQEWLNVMEEVLKIQADESMTVYRYAERIKRLRKKVK